MLLLLVKTITSVVLFGEKPSRAVNVHGDRPTWLRQTRSGRQRNDAGTRKPAHIHVCCKFCAVRGFQPQSHAFV